MSRYGLKPVLDSKMARRDDFWDNAVSPCPGKDIRKPNKCWYDLPILVRLDLTDNNLNLNTKWLVVHMDNFFLNPFVTGFFQFYEDIITLSQLFNRATRHPEMMYVQNTLTSQ